MSSPLWRETDYLYMIVRQVWTTREFSLYQRKNLIFEKMDSNGVPQILLNPSCVLLKDRSVGMSAFCMRPNVKGCSYEISYKVNKKRHVVLSLSPCSHGVKSTRTEREITHTQSHSTTANVCTVAKLAVCGE